MTTSGPREVLLRSIASTIADFRSGEIPAISAPHVDRWVRQFDQADQLTILSEMHSILLRYYFTRAKAKAALRRFAQDVLVGASGSSQILTKTHFLRLQPTVSSQGALLTLMDEILQEDFGHSVAACGQSSPESYVYIDDAIYTGNRLRCDMENGDDTPAWIRKQAPRASKLIVFTLASHARGFSYASSNVRYAAYPKAVDVAFYTALDIDDTYGLTSKAECLWPETWTGDPSVDAYVGSVSAKCIANGWTTNNLFRPTGVPSTEALFSSPAARRTVERAFLRAGCQLRALYAGPKLEMRPLGYEKLESLGFGTPFVTYQNIANNCPVVLWWSFDWYPLFPRRTNVRTGGMMGDTGISPDDIPF